MHKPDCGILEPYPFHGDCDCGALKKVNKLDAQHKLVSREPTPEMVEAACAGTEVRDWATQDTAKLWNAEQRSNVAGRWRLMWDAAPVELPPSARWIPVEERLPEDRLSSVLIYSPDLNVPIVSPFHMIPSWYRRTHWMPLPSPPPAFDVNLLEDSGRAGPERAAISDAIKTELAPPKGFKPHVFVGRADRSCEVCNTPDRNPIHYKTNEQLPADWEHPNWAEYRKVHCWRNHVGEEIIVLWETFSLTQKKALAKHAEEQASAEEWE